MCLSMIAFDHRFYVTTVSKSAYAQAISTVKNICHTPVNVLGTY